MERKFERKTEQNNPTNPSGDLKKPKAKDKFNPDTKTIKEQKTKK